MLVEGVKKIKILAPLITAVLFLFFIVQADFAGASFSRQINYQGKLLNSSGTPVFDDDYAMEFKLFSSPVGGSELWSESRNGVNSVTVSSGLFSVMLGGVNPLPLDDDFFNQSLYLEVSVGSSSLETLTPRKLLGSVPTSLFSSNSSKLGGLASSSFLRSDATNAAAFFVEATSTNFFSSTLTAVNSFFSDLIAAAANIVSLVFDSAIGNHLAVTGLNVTSTANIKNLNASSSIAINSTSTNFYAGNISVGTGLMVDGTTTLATTSMSFGSYIGDAGTGISFAKEYFYEASTTSYFPFFAMNFNSNDISSLFGNNIGTMSRGLNILEGNSSLGDNYPTLNFVSRDFISGADYGNYASIYYSTSSKTLDFNGTYGGYYFNNGPVNISNNLVVNGTTTASCFTVDGISCITGGPGSSQWSNNGSNIYFNTGNVGIGSSSPSTKLVVYGTSTLVGGLIVGSSTARADFNYNYNEDSNLSGLKIRNMSTGTSATTEIQVWNDINQMGFIGSGSSNYNLYDFYKGGMAVGSLYDLYLASGAYGKILFKQGIDMNEPVMAIDAGKLGIGTTTPEYTLTVASDSSFLNLHGKNGANPNIIMSNSSSSNIFGISANLLGNEIGFGVLDGSSNLIPSTFHFYGTTTASCFSVDGVNCLGGSAVSGGGSNWIVSDDGFLTTSTTIPVAISGGNDLSLYVTSTFIGGLFESGLSFSDVGWYLGNLFDLPEVPAGIGLMTFGSTTGSLMMGRVGSVSIGSNLGGAFISGADGISPFSEISNYDGVGLLVIGSSTGLRVMASSSDGYAVYSSNGLNYFSGNVGIGTSTPTQKLTVVGTSTFWGDISVSGGLLDTTGSYGAYGQVLMSLGTSTLWVSTTTLGMIGGEIVGGSSQWLDSGSDIYFNAGNVGVGTSTPNVKLQVSGGDVLFDGDNQAIYTINPPNNPVLSLQYNPTQTWDNYYYLANGSTQTYHIYSYRDINGVKVFSADYLEASIVDDNSGQYYYVEISWDEVNEVDGYLIIKPEEPYGRYVEVYTNSAEDHFWMSAMSEDSLVPKSPYVIESGIGLFYDSVNTRIGIGTTTPIAKLHIEGDGAILAVGKYNGGVEYDNDFGWDGGELGAGTRLMWVPHRAAFRVGSISGLSGNFGGSEWDNLNIGEYSFAGGYDTVASGVASFAFGDSALASGYHSTAFGYGTVASGDNSFAIGYTTLASGNSSIAMGYGTIASYDQAVAMGDQTIASGLASFAMGGNTVASGYYSTALGYQTLSSGWMSMAIGDRNEASGDASFASGYRSIASGTNAFAHGYYSYATGWEAIALGAMITVSGDNSVGIGLNRSVGIGTYNVTQNNTMAIMGGNVGIGTTTPSSALSVVGSAYFSGNIGLGTTTLTSNKLSVIGNSFFGGSITATGTVSLYDTLRMYGTSSNFYSGFNSPSGLTQNLTWTLPNQFGDGNKYLVSDINGVLNWSDLPTMSGVNLVFNEIKIIAAAFPATSVFLWTNMPAVRTELFGNTNSRVSANLYGASKFRLTANQSVIGSTTATFRVEYSLDNVNFFQLEDGTTNGDLEANTVAFKVGSWVSIAPGAKTEVYLRITGAGGNGTADPAWKQLTIQFLSYGGSQWANEGGGNISYVGGDIGIGTTSPQAKLHILGSTSSTDLFAISSSSNERLLTVNNVGNLGLGITAPTERLAVAGNGLFQLTATSSLTISSVNFGGLADVPLLTGYAYTENVTSANLNILGIADRLALMEKDGLGPLSLSFYNGSLNSIAEIFVTTSTKSVVFDKANNWSFNNYDTSKIALGIDVENDTVFLNSLDTNGAVYSNNGILTNVAPSSQDYKNTIQSVDLNIDALLGLQVKSFIWNNNNQTDFGLIAEEIGTVLPELYVDNGKVKGYRADHLPFYLLQIAQKQKQEISVLSEQVSQLNNKALEVLSAPTDVNNFTNLSVSSAATFYGTLTVIGEAGFESKVTFKDDVEIQGKLYLDKDQVGTAIISSGSTSIEVLFSKPFVSSPRVLLSPDFSGKNPIFVNYAVSNKSIDGFTIVIDRSVSEDLYFDWAAFGQRFEATSQVSEDYGSQGGQTEDSASNPDEEYEASIDQEESFPVSTTADLLIENNIISEDENQEPLPI